eukprot:1195406-Prorocentrum_minimum.AAC.3
MKGHAAVVKALLEGGADARLGGRTRACTPGGGLHCIAALRLYVLRLYCDYDWCRTALHLAAEAGHVDVIKVLLAADPDCIDLYSVHPDGAYKVPPYLIGRGPRLHQPPQRASFLSSIRTPGREVSPKPHQSSSIRTPGREVSPKPHQSSSIRTPGREVSPKPHQSSSIEHNTIRGIYNGCATVQNYI